MFAQCVCVFLFGRRVGEAAACVPQPALLLALHQPLPGCRVGQLFFHHAGHCGRRHSRSEWVSEIKGHS